MIEYKILIADDHAMVRDGLKNLLKQHREYNVVGEAASGAETLKLFAEKNPDLLILDISMPDMNGMDVSRAILQDTPDASIIIFSMYDGEDYINKCLELGVKGYVLKNETGAELDTAIKNVLNGGNYFSRQVQNVIFRKYSVDMSKKKVQEEPVNLTRREIEIVSLISEGLTSQQMADKLFISARTVETHRANLMKKLRVKNAIELVKKIHQLGILT